MDIAVVSQQRQRAMSCNTAKNRRLRLAIGQPALYASLRSKQVLSFCEKSFFFNALVLFFGGVSFLVFGPDGKIMPLRRN
jgi:hypothetical protein